jgi:environmental stress-induced protein Ves
MRNFASRISDATGSLDGAFSQVQDISRQLVNELQR